MLRLLSVLSCALAVCIVSGANPQYYLRSPLLKGDAKYLVHIVRSENDKFPCPGVPISDYHVLTTTSCLLSPQKKFAVRVGYSSPHLNIKRIAAARVTDDYVVKAKTIRKRFENSLAVIKLKDRLNSTEVLQVQLPKQNVARGDTGLASGLAGVCVMTSPRFREHPVTVNDPQSCVDLRPDEFCVGASPQLQSINHGAPVVDKDNVILGFTTFGCNSIKPGPVLNVFPFVDWIKKVQLDL